MNSTFTGNKGIGGNGGNAAASQRGSRWGAAVVAPSMGRGHVNITGSTFATNSSTGW